MGPCTKRFHQPPSVINPEQLLLARFVGLLQEYTRLPECTRPIALRDVEPSTLGVGVGLSAPDSTRIELWFYPGQVKIQNAEGTYCEEFNTVSRTERDLFRWVFSKIAEVFDMPSPSQASPPSV